MPPNIRRPFAALGLSLLALVAQASTCDPGAPAGISPQIAMLQESKCAQQALQTALELQHESKKAEGLADTPRMCSQLHAALMTLDLYLQGDWRKKYDDIAEDVDQRYAELKNDLLKTTCRQKPGLIRLLAERGDAWAMYTIGNAHYTGKTLPQNDALALSWLEKSAGRGYVPAYLALGRIYSEGQAFLPDHATAFAWYLKAAGSGDAEAQYIVAGMYRQGIGTGRDNAKAAEWYRKAAEQEHKNAQARLQEMYRAGEAKKPFFGW